MDIWSKEKTFVGYQITFGIHFLKKEEVVIFWVYMVGLMLELEKIKMFKTANEHKYKWGSS